MDRFAMPGTRCPAESVAPDPGRRRFIRDSLLSLCAAGVVAPSGIWASPMADDLAAVGLVSHHEGLGRPFAAAAERGGLVFIVGADPWSAAERIAALGASGSPPILAATCQASFLVLSQLAMEAGYRLVYVGDHRQVGGGETRHSLRGDHHWVAAASRAVVEDSWAQRLYPALRECLSRQSPGGEEGRCVLTGPGLPVAMTDPHWRTWAMVSTSSDSMAI